MTVVKAKITAAVTVIRSRLRSTTVEPAAADATGAAEHVGQATAPAAVQEDEQDQGQRHAHVDEHDPGRQVEHG